MTGALLTPSRASARPTSGTAPLRAGPYTRSPRGMHLAAIVGVLGLSLAGCSNEGCGQTAIAKSSAPGAVAVKAGSTAAAPTHDKLAARSARAKEILMHDPALPGIDHPDASLDASLKAASKKRRAGAAPRTRHRLAGGSGEPKYVNRLALEGSPYLQQHSNNPVNWMPWGEDAFERARVLDRPIFLSIGYSTCHWCHVMEEESFEDETIAAFVNANFVAIKVDREERPDVDAAYMNAVQAMTGSGGWPMSLVLTPNLEPFFAATYLPPHSGVRGARMGLMEILERLHDEFTTHRDKLLAQAKQITAHLLKATASRPAAALPNASVIGNTVGQLLSRYDSVRGGFGHAPKFPRPVTLELMMRYARRTPDDAAKNAAIFTLLAMADGGLNDQLGGGFHRYSTDARWRVPHFEKMLYDNAQLVCAYLDGWQLSGDDRLREVAETTLDYLIREMQSPEGGFYGATDADSKRPDGEMEEGYFFTFTPGDLASALGAADAKLAETVFGVSSGGDIDGRSVLHRDASDEALAKTLGLSMNALHSIRERLRKALLAVRAKRIPPLRDSKILVSWNGLAISALARGGHLLKRPDFIAAADRAAEHLLGKARIDGVLHRSITAGKLGAPAFLDDHVMLAMGLVDLYEATGTTHYLKDARALVAALDAGFWDEANGGYFQTGKRHEHLITREKPDYDGALPSGNSVAALLLLRLADLGSDAALRTRAEKILASQAQQATQAGPAVPLLLSALERSLDTPVELVLVQPAGMKDAAGYEALLSALRKQYLPNHTLSLVTEETLAEHAKIVSLVEGKIAKGGKATAYVCRNRMCKLPTHDPKVFATQLAETAPLP